jgi:YD repeat-containing protein
MLLANLALRTQVVAAADAEKDRADSPSPVINNSHPAKINSSQTVPGSASSHQIYGERPKAYLPKSQTNSEDANYGTYYAQSFVETGSIGTITSGNVSFENSAGVLGAPDGNNAAIINNACPNQSILAYEIVDFGQTIYLNGTADGGTVAMYAQRQTGFTRATLQLQVSADKNTWIDIGGLFSLAETTPWSLISGTYVGYVRYARLFVRRDTISCDWPVSVRYEIDYIQINGKAVGLFDRSFWSYNKPKNGSGDGRECAVNGCGDAQAPTGDPINTYSGNFDYSLVDLSVPTAAGALSFQPSYSSAGVNLYTQPMGYGWTHNQDIRLIFPNDPGGEAGTVWFKAETANQFKLTQNDDGTYTPYAGVLASLVKNGDQYVLTDSAQNVYTFGSDGKVLSWTNPQGLGFTYEYTDSLLSRVVDPSTERYLTFTYDNSQLTAVADQTGRSVSFTYATGGDLATVTDVRGKTSTYSYDGFHHLTELTDPLSNNQFRNVYDSQGRVKEQYDANNKLTRSITYGSPDSNSNTANIVTNALGNNITYTYDARGVLTGTTDPLSDSTTRTYDSNFRLTGVSAPAGHTVQATWSDNGINQLSSTDAGNILTTRQYDSLNNLTHVIVDPSGKHEETSYTYQGKLLTSTTNASGKTTTYTYTTSAEAPQPPGLLKTTTDPLSHTTTYAYNEFGQQISVTDTLDHTTLYSYDNLGRLVDTTDPQGQVTHNEYNPAGLITSSVRNYDPNRPQNDQNLYNLTTTYEYDDAGRQTQVTDTLGHATHYEYDSNGRLIHTTDAMDKVTSSEYDDEGNLVATIDALDKRTEYHFDANGRSTGSLDPTGHGATNSFDVPTNISTVTDALGHETAFQYDALNRVIKTTDPLEHFTSSTYDANGNVATTTDKLGLVTYNQYDEMGRLVQQTRNYDPSQTQNYRNLFNLVTQYVYDDAGRQTKIIDTTGKVTLSEYDDLGRLVRQTQNYDPSHPQNYNNQYNIVTQYEFDQAGNQVNVTDTFGRVTHNEYDVLGQLLTQTRNYDPNRSQNAENQYNIVTAYTYDALGRQVTVTDTLGHVTFSEYDDDGRLLRQTQNYDSAHPQNYQDQYNIVTQYGYDDDGRQITVTDTLGRVTYNEYDDAGRLLHQTQNYDPNRPQNDQNQYNLVTSYQYDVAGNQTEITTPDGQVTYNQYDQLVRLLHQTKNYDPSHPQNYQDQYNLVTSYQYDAAGNRTDVTGPNGVVTHYNYDPLDHPVDAIRNYKDGQNSTIDTNVAEHYGYDVLGNRLTVTDANGSGHTTHYGYDLLNRQVSVIDPVNNSQSSSYDALGKLLSHSDGNGATVQYEYDALDRKVKDNYPGSEPYVTFVYDALGRTASMSDGLGTTTWTYDALGRVTSITDPDGAKVAYSYDPLGRRTSLTAFVPGDTTGKTASYQYDAAGRVANLIDWANQTTAYSYDSVGRLLSVTRPNGINSTYVYNAAGQLSSLIHTTSASTIASYQYIYDKNGSLLKATENLNRLQAPGLPQPPSQLTADQTGFSAIALTWMDNASNEDGFNVYRSTEGQNNWTKQSELGPDTVHYTDRGLARSTLYWYKVTAFNAQGESSPSITQTGTAFDPVGDDSTTPPPSSLEIDYEYDSLNRLAKAVYNDGHEFDYSYDPAGNTLLAKQITNSQTVTTSYTYDAASQLSTAQSTDTQVTWHYSYDNNGSLIELIPGENGPTNGARKYSYNTAGQLTKVEQHDGTSYQTQSQMSYNGLGQRLSVSGAGQTLNYLVDQAGDDSPLAAYSSGQASYYLNGAGPLGKFNTAWNYYLPDGVNSIRQVTDLSGATLLTTSYTPWGEVLSQTGAAGALRGYMGGLWDPTTGLIYAGSGQYYDPATGRFLTRQNQAGNPYLPAGVDPIGAMVGPLALVGLLAGKSRKKKLGLVIMVLIVLLATGVALAGCNSNSGPIIDRTQTPPKNKTSSPSPSATSGGTTETPGPSTQSPSIPTGTCPAPQHTPTPEPTPGGPGGGSPSPEKYIGEYVMSAYFIFTEDLYSASAPVPIPADDKQKLSLGYKLSDDVYLSAAGPYHYNDLGPDYYQLAPWSFIHDPDGICENGTGEIPATTSTPARYITCTTPRGTPIADQRYEWQTDEKLKVLFPFNTIAVSPGQISGLLPIGTSIEIPDLNGYLQEHHADTTLTVRDQGNGLSPNESGYKYEALDLFVGTGPSARDAYNELIREFPRDKPLKVYRK